MSDIACKLSLSTIPNWYAKEEAFWTFEECDPDFVLVSGTWLHTGVGQSEVQPANYRIVARKDRKRNDRSVHGGAANVAKINMATPPRLM